MRLIQDTSNSAYAVSVPCIVCGKMLSLYKAVIDLDGPSFAAYYHVECLPKDYAKHLVHKDCGYCDCGAK